MPIHTSSPVATKALSVASKKLCLSPVAWPSIRANSSLAASSLLHTWWPHFNSMTWTHEAHDEMPQCRASKQYSSLSSLLDFRLSSSPEPERQTSTACEAGTACGRDVDVDGHPCVEQVFLNEQDTRDETNVIAQRTHGSIATNGGGFSQEGKIHDLCTGPAHVNGHYSDQRSAEPTLPTKMKHGVAQEQRLGPPDERKYADACPHQSTTLSYALVTNPAIALNMARHDFESKVDRLERRCFELFVENQQLKMSAEKLKVSHARTQELNLRLGREVQQARRESATATEHLRQFEEKARKSAMRSKRTCASRHQSTQTSSQCDIEIPSDTVEAMDKIQSEECINLQNLLPTWEDHAFVCYPPGLENNSQVRTHNATHEDAQHCRSDESHGWGCFHHRTYSSSLLLAHRQLRLAIAHGAPGLELPSDKLAQANSGHLGIYVATAASLMSSPDHTLALPRM